MILVSYQVSFSFWGLVLKGWPTVFLQTELDLTQISKTHISKTQTSKTQTSAMQNSI